METEYLDEEQVISLYNKVRTGKKAWRHSKAVPSMALPATSSC